MNYDFEQYPYLGEEVYKLQCGRHLRNQVFICNLMDTGAFYYMGEEYSREKGNPPVCAGLKECDNCESCITQGLGFNICAATQMEENFDFENSVNKIIMDYNQAYHIEVRDKFGENSYCACMHQQYDKVLVKYNPEECRRFGAQGCLNDFCVIRKKSRDTSMCNIFYDLKHIQQSGLFTYEDWETNLKYFDHSVTRDLAEEFFKLIKKQEPEKLNLRISTKKPRDLMEDLMRVKTGEHLGQDKVSMVRVLESKEKRKVGIKKRNQLKKQLRLERKKAKELTRERKNTVKQAQLCLFEEKERGGVTNGVTSLLSPALASN